ncbi:MAG: acyl carrier protein [Solirubrobacteraceae bacterium]|nr:acyl carrier protein [Solirubrobacteraceae bacterium]
MSTDHDQQLREVLASVLEVDVQVITDDASPDTIESWDSLAHLNLILALEEEFGVTIPDAEAAELTSLPLIRIVVAEQLSDTRRAA